MAKMPISGCVTTQVNEQLYQCCAGARAALFKLMRDRESLSNTDILAINERMRQVMEEADITRRRLAGREDDGSTGY